MCGMYAKPRRMAWAATVCWSLLAAGWPLPAVAETLTVTGFVKMPDGFEPSAVTVELRPMSSHFDWCRRVLADAPLPGPITAARLDAAGAFRLMAPGIGIYEVRVQAPGLVALRHRPTPVAAPVTLPPVALQSDAGTRVEVRDTAGRPVAGAWVYVQTASRELWQSAHALSWAADSRWGQTAADGTLRIPRLADERLTLRVFPPGGMEATVAEAEAEARVVVDREAGRTRILEIRAPGGSGLAGIAVLSGSPPWPVGETGPQGQMTLRGRFIKPLEMQIFAGDGRHLSFTLPPLSPEGPGPVEPEITSRTLPPLTTIAGRVTQGNPGKPVAAAVVWAGHEPARYVVSGSDGGFRIEVAPLDRFWLRTRARGFLTAEIEGGRTQLQPDWRPVLQLTLATALRGQVMDAERRPIAGALLEAASASGERPEWAVSDPRGQFQLAGLDPRRTFQLQVTRRDFAPLTLRLVSVPAGRDSLDLGTLTLRPEAVLAGTVMNPEGKALAGARVWRLREGETSPRRFIERGRPPGRSADAVTEAGGKFRLAGLASGERLDLVVDAQGHLPAEVSGVVLPLPAPMRVILEPASKASGRVVDDAGEGVAGAEVRLSPQAPPDGVAGVPRARQGTLSVVSDEQGGFLFRQVMSGPAQIDAYASGFAPSAEIAVEVPPAGSLKELRLVLKRGAVLAGVISNSRGDPVEKARVQAGRPSTVTDTQGRYRLEGVIPGTRRVSVRHSDYNELKTQMDIQPEINRGDFVLTGGWPVAGRTVDEDGRPVAGARVAIQGQEGAEQRAYRTVSDEAGEFRFPRVADGTYDLEAAREGYADTRRAQALRVDGAAAETEVVLAKGGAVWGQILGLATQELAWVEVQAKDRFGLTRRGQADYRGAYEIADLAHGDYRITARLPGGSRQAEGWVTLEGEALRVRRDLEFNDGLTLTGAVHYDGAALPSTVISITGVEVSSQRTVVTDFQGRFRIEGLERGRYRLALSNAREQLIHHEEVHLTSDRELMIEMATGEVTGAVKAAGSARPIAGATVFLHLLAGPDSHETRSLFSVVTNEAGFFHQARLATGTYRLAVQKDGYAPAERMLDVRAGARRENLDLELTPTQGLDLAIRYASGQIPRTVTVVVLDAAGRRVLSELRGLTPEGFTHLATLPAGNWEVLIGAPGAVSTRFSAVVPGEARTVVLPLAGQLLVRVPALARSGLTATVALADSSGQPFQGLDLNGELRVRWEAQGGNAVLDGVPSGVWMVSVVAADGQTWQAPATIAAAAQTVMNLE